MSDKPDKPDKGKQPSKEQARDKWAADLAKSGGLEIKGSPQEQPTEASSSSKNASVKPMVQPLYVTVSLLVTLSY